MKIILGINVGRESGASLIIDNKILAAVNEERISRKKNDYGFPFLSIENVLSLAKISIKDLNIIAIEGLKFSPTVDNGFTMNDSDFKKKIVGNFGLGKLLLSNKIGLKICQLLLLPSLFYKRLKYKKFFNKFGFNGKIFYVDHHVCHANTAFYTQGRESGMTVTFDANGEGYCSKVFLCKNGQMNLVHKEFGYNSPAYYYAYITHILGFTPNKHEGKITGLAAFGNASIVEQILKKYIRYIPEKNRFLNYGGFHIKTINRIKSDLEEFSKEDIAAGIQALVEEWITSYINYLIFHYANNKKTNLFLAGGLFANVKLNQKISELDSIKSLYIFPNMGDGGLNLGAALQFSNKVCTDISNVSLGNKYSYDEIRLELNNSGLKFYKSSNIAQDMAKIIFDQKIVAFFSGRMEYGPRALGNRSILFLPNDIKTNLWLNERLGRTDFMPFAPVTRDIDAYKYFEIDSNKDIDYRFMTITVNVTPHTKKVAPAIVHIDGTARPQILNRSNHYIYYDTLTHLDNLCGEGILVNTSFNMHEEPIINTPFEAIRCFKKCRLDVLVIEDFIIFNA